MTDRNVEPVLDLSRETLLRACKGDVKKLPTFVVHDDDAWPWATKVRPAKGAIHVRRSTFNNVIAPQVPVKPGLFVRMDAQEYLIDLKPHHLQGSEDQAQHDPKGNNHDAARKLAVADEVGRLPDEEDYGTKVVERSPWGKAQRDDLERIARDPNRNGVRSSLFSGVRDTEPVAMGDDD